MGKLPDDPPLAGVAGWPWPPNSNAALEDNAPELPLEAMLTRLDDGRPMLTIAELRRAIG